MSNLNPRLSIIVIVFDMPHQAMNTVRSLSVRHQRNVREEDYEILVVENESARMLDADAVCALGSNVRYLRRNEQGVSPAPAINEGLSQVRAPVVGLLIDGARMVTPRVIEYALMAHAVAPDALTAVPGYFIGPCEHQFAAEHGYTETVEAELMARIRWQENPYRLFDVCTMSAANPRGVFVPFMECNCFFTSRLNFERVGGADERFDLPGGGALNMYLFRNIGLLPGCSHFFIFPGEGSFHQLHGGVTTSPVDERKAMLFRFRDQLQAISGPKHFRSVMREPILLGAVTSHARRFLHYSSERAQIRFSNLAAKQQSFWPDDAAYERYTECQG